MFSCSKEDQTDFANIQQNDQVYIKLDIPIITNPYPIESYLINEIDPDEEKICRHLLEIGIATRSLWLDQSFISRTLEKAAQSYNSCANLNELVSFLHKKSTDQRYNQLAVAVKNADLTHLSQNPFNSVEIENYIPAIFIPNIETSDMNKSPIISSGIEVNSELPGMEEYEDYIVGWYNDEDGNFIEILLNEEAAMTTTHPLFIIDNAEEEFTSMNKSLRTKPYQISSLKSASSSEEVHTNEYKINYRYENTGDSEFCITAALIDENGNAGFILYDGGIKEWKRIAKVDKHDIGDQLHHWEQFCSYEVEPYTSNFAFWNTWERDWAQSRKSLGSATANGKTIHLYGRRRFSSEWYGVNPDYLQDYPVDFEEIFYTWAKWYENSKGNLRFWKVIL